MELTPDKQVEFTANPSSKGHVLVTGGSGYIGTHTVLCLIENGYDVTVIDNLSNSCPEGLERVKRITKCDPNRLRFANIEMCNEMALEQLFKSSSKFHSCIHFAGLKSVGESVVEPLKYYENNLRNTLNLLKMLEKYDCRSLVFSSSATVYGAAEVPITESSPAGQGITNPYGKTKYMIEEILKDFAASKTIKEESLKDTENEKSDSVWNIIILRYFNPVGAHPSGLIGEDPNGIPNNLMPFVSQVAVGRRPKLSVYGNDYATPDGTGVRDYIHVMDLADGHLAALKYIERSGFDGDEVVNEQQSLSKVHQKVSKLSVFNLGTGKGHSVLEIIAAMKAATGKDIPYEFAPRRKGDIAICYANANEAHKVLGWSAKRNLMEMCSDAWKWQSNNPNGYINS